MADESTTVIEIIAQVTDQTAAGAQSATQTVSKLEKTMKQAQEAADGLKKASKIEMTINAIDKASSIINGIARTGKSIAGKVWQVTLKAKDMITGPLRSIVGGIMGPIMQGIGMSAGMGISSMISQAITNAGRAETGNIAMSAVAKATETNISLLNRQKQAVMSLGIQEQEATGIMTQFMQAQLNVADASKVARVAQDAAVIAGTNSSEAAATMVDAISSLNPMLLKQFGMTKKQTDIFNDYAEQQGLVVKTTDKYGKTVRHMTRELDDAEKKQAMLNYVLAQGEKIAGTYESAMESPFKKLGSLPRHVTDFFQAFGTPLFLPVFGKAVDAVTELFDKGKNWAIANKDMLESWGKAAADWFDGAKKKFDSFLEKVKGVMSTSEFQSSDLFGKIKIVWNDVIVKPFEEWWDSGGQKWLAEKAAGLGKGLGTGLKTGILALLGINADGGLSIGKSFADSFLEGFDTPRVMKAIWDAILSFMNAQPLLSALFIGFKALPMLGSGLKTVSAVRSLFGGAGMAGASGAGGLLGGGSAVLSTVAVAASAVTAGVTALKSAANIYNGLHNQNKEEGQSQLKQGGAMAGGLLMGAAVGTAILPGVGTVIGAGIGALIGQYAASRVKQDYENKLQAAADAAAKAEAAKFLQQEQAKYESQSLKDALADSSVSAEEFGQKFDNEVVKRLKDRFGSIQLSLTEIKDIANKLTFGKAADGLQQFANSTKDVQSSISGLQTATDELIKLNWKHGAGFWDTTDVDNYKNAINNVIQAQKDLVINKAFRAGSAFGTMTNPEQGASLSQASNYMYRTYLDQLTPIEKEMQDIMNKNTLSDDDYATLIELQQKRQGILQPIQDAENKSSFDLIGAEYGGAGLTYDSFTALNKEAMNQHNDYLLQAQEAYKTRAAEIEQMANNPEYNTGEYVFDADKARADNLADFEKAKKDANDKMLKWLTDTINTGFSDENGNILPELDLSGGVGDKLKTALTAGLSEGIDFTGYTTEDWRKFLNTNGLSDVSEELAGEIQKFVSPDMAIYEEKGKSIGDSLSTGFTTNVDFDKDGKTTNKLLQFINDLQNAADNTKVQIQTEIIAPDDNTGGFGYQPPGDVPPPPGAAAGGIFTTPQMRLFAEDGPEAAIPLSNRSRGLSLWRQAGKILGASGDIEPLPISVSASSAGVESSTGAIVPVTIQQVTLEVNVDGGNEDNIVNNIKKNFKDLADSLAYELSMAVQQSYANTPTVIGDVF